MSESLISSQNDADDMYYKLHRLVSIRKKYPTILMGMEREKFDKELKALENIHVELDDYDKDKEIKMMSSDTRNLAKKLVGSHSSFPNIQDSYDKSKMEMANLESFLIFKKSFRV